MFLTYALLASCFVSLEAFCTGNVRRHNFKIEDVYGMWFGAGYVQHIPDLTNRPNKIGCISMYISDITEESREDWTGMDTSLIRRNWTDPDWQSPYNTPWSNTPMSGSWLDYRMRHISKRDISRGERRLQVVWDEDGQTEEQNYIYSPETPNVWRLEQWNPEMSEVYARGLANLDLWHPEDQPTRPEHIYILKAKPDVLILHHCSQVGVGRAFSLLLRRTPVPMAGWDWHDVRKVMFTYQLPNVFRHTAICDGSDSGSARVGAGLNVLGGVILALLGSVQ